MTLADGKNKLEMVASKKVKRKGKGREGNELLILVALHGEWPTWNHSRKATQESDIWDNIVSKKEFNLERMETRLFRLWFQHESIFRIYRIILNTKQAFTDLNK